MLSDYACYYHISRVDHGNAGFRPLEPRGYLGNLAEALDIVDANTEPGPARDRLHRRWMRVEIVGRMRGRRLLRADPDFREEFVREARTLVQDRFALGVDAGLSPLDHLVARLLRTGDLPALLQLADWESKLKVQALLRGIRCEDGALVLDVAGVLFDGMDNPVELQDRDGSRVLMPPLPSGILETLPPDLLDVGDSTVSLDLFARHKETGTEQFLSGAVGAGPGLGLGATSLSRLPVDTESADTDSAPLIDGVWEVFARWRAFGWIFSPAVTVPARAPGADDPIGGPALIGAQPRLARPHRTSRSGLRVELTGASPAVPPTVPRLRVDRGRSTASAHDRSLAMDVSLLLVTDRSRHVTVHVAQDGSESVHVWPAVLDPVPADEAGRAGSRLSVSVSDVSLAPGRWTLRLAPDDVSYALPVACPFTVREDRSVRLGRNPPPSYRGWVRSLLPAAVVRRLRTLRNGVRARLPAPVVRRLRTLRNEVRGRSSRTRHARNRRGS